MRLPAFGRSLVLLTALLAGCSGGKNGSGDISPETFCKLLRDAVCEMRTRCGHADTVEGCIKQEEAWHGVPNCEPLVASVNDKRATFDAAVAKTCLDAVKTEVACSDGDAEPDSCKSAIVGAGAAGASCYTAYDCDGTSYCDSAAKVCPGTCKARKSNGETATSSGQCHEGLYFDFNQSKCLTLVAKDGACMASSHCQKGLYCASNKCTEKLALGAACPNGQGCHSDLRCDATSKTCVALTKRGETCKNTLDCPMDLTCANGTCGDKLAVGAACSNTLGACTYDSYCETAMGAMSGTCTATKAAGGTCSGFGQCAKDTYCKQTNFSQPGTCEANIAAGGACTVTQSGCELWYMCEAVDAGTANGTCVRSICMDDTI